MKKQIYSLIALAFLAVMISSCGKDDTPDIPGGGGGDNNHPELWHYDGKIKGLADIVPAIDESGNIYFAGTEEGAAGGSFHFVSVDKNGNERWDKTITATGAASYVVYADGKVFVGIDDPVSIHAFDAGSGDEIWTKDYAADYDFVWMPAMAYANHTLYVSSGQIAEGFLFALNPNDGSELWINRLYDDYFLNVAVDGSKIYVGGMGEVTCFTDNGGVADSTWHWEADSKASRGFAFSDINIAENGNLYIREGIKVYIISSASGQVIATADLSTEFENSSSGLTIDDDGNFYIGNGDWYKFSGDGSLVWKTDIQAGVINPNYVEAPAIAENGNLYNGELFSLSCVKSNGSLNWMIGTEQGVGNLHPVVIDHDGNLITYSTEKGVLYCYKGDGSKLATSGWPKRYGSMGNTCSK